MPKRDTKAFLYDILSYMDDIIEFTKDMDYEEFINNKAIKYAVIRCLEVIGEAVKKIPKDISEKYPHIPFRELARMRDKLIHQYFGVDYLVVWETAKYEIPEIKREFEKIIKDIEGENENSL
ncbi:DUF86 domain-containing protein [Methanocaldococcus indicus]|uniref:HepT-like ribonuclease domain-containing protein n=1 Tax=Methanocaldococcus indicus TaxID=213231 RepID=UPI003C6D82B9